MISVKFLAEKKVNHFVTRKEFAEYIGVSYKTARKVYAVYQHSIGKELDLTWKDIKYIEENVLIHKKDNKLRAVS